MLPETKVQCHAASPERLGLLATGSRLVTILDSEHRLVLSRRSARRAWPTAGIATFVEPEAGVIMVSNTETDIPRFAGDEFDRFLSEFGSPYGNQNQEGEAK